MTGLQTIIFSQCCTPSPCPSLPSAGWPERCWWADSSPNTGGQWEWRSLWLLISWTEGTNRGSVEPGKGRWWDPPCWCLLEVLWWASAGGSGILPWSSLVASSQEFTQVRLLSSLGSWHHQSSSDLSNVSETFLDSACANLSSLNWFS